jgi:hypothetical protein
MHLDRSTVLVVCRRRLAHRRVLDRQDQRDTDNNLLHTRSAHTQHTSRRRVSIVTCWIVRRRSRIAVTSETRLNQSIIPQLSTTKQAQWQKHFAPFGVFGIDPLAVCTVKLVGAQSIPRRRCPQRRTSENPIRH